MSWQSDREEWNRQDKCARAACRASLETNLSNHRYTHITSNLQYCAKCAKMINDANYGIAGKNIIILRNNCYTND